MKKMLVLIIFVFFLTTGCYDYAELNDMAIVSGISIDYQEEEFNVGFEILNTKNKEDTQEKEKVYLAQGNGKSIAEAFSDVALEIAKTPYLAHLKTLIIDEETAKNHLEEIIDFLIRDNHIRNIFYLVMAKDVPAFEILDHTDVNNPIVSTAISKLIESTSYTSNIASDLNFEKFVMNIIDPRKDTYITTIEIQNDILKLGPLAIFKKYNFQTFLTEKESAMFNLMNGSSNEMYFKIECPNNSNQFIILSTFKSSESSMEIEENNVTISTEIETKIIENHCEMDFKGIETYEKLQNNLEEILQKEMQEVVEKSLLYDSDILKIGETYYQKYKKEIDFTKLNYKYEATAIINRNGLIFEVKK